MSPAWRELDFLQLGLASDSSLHLCLSLSSGGDRRQLYLQARLQAGGAVAAALCSIPSGELPVSPQFLQDRPS